MYNTKVYRKQGGDELVVDAGGKVDMRTGSQVLADGAQAGAIANPAGGATVDAEARAAINSVLAALRGAGIIAP